MPNKEIDAFFEIMDAQAFKLTYDDVRLATCYSEILPEDADLSSRFSRRVSLRVPIVSSPMDAVTEYPMAIAMATFGGLGVIHRNLIPKEQARHVKRVKHHLNGRIDTPIVVLENTTVGELHALRKEKDYKFHSFPVVSDDGRFLGMLTKRDLKFAVGDDQMLTEIMTRYDDTFVTGAPDLDVEAAYKLMRSSKKNIIPLLDAQQKVVGMYGFSDLERVRSADSMHNVDEEGRLRVGAAIGVGDEALQRAALLEEAGCDVVVIDTAHGFSKKVTNTIAAVKRKHHRLDVVAGNVSGGDGAKHLVAVGADGVLVGQGPGSICTTRRIAGIGCPQVSAVYECVKALEDTGVPVCADGGIAASGDIAVALAIGAESVILGSLLAGTDESPGDIVSTPRGQIKMYRGMGSLAAMQERAASAARYSQSNVSADKLVPEGVSGSVPYIGSVADALTQHAGGIRSSMGYLGTKNLTEFNTRAKLFRITNAGLKESHPHNLASFDATTNYGGSHGG